MGGQGARSSLVGMEQAHGRLPDLRGDLAHRDAQGRGAAQGHAHTHPKAKDPSLTWTAVDLLEGHEQAWVGAEDAGEEEELLARVTGQIPDLGGEGWMVKAKGTLLARIDAEDRQSR